jgi:hypothetical protein
MRARLTKPEIGEMVSVAESIAAGKTPPPRFFELWPDIAPGEDKDVTELWFSASYYENDSEAGAESAEYFREAMLKYASSLRARFQLERKEPIQPPQTTTGSCAPDRV